MVATLEKGSVMVSDEWYSPKILSPRYSHVTIELKNDEPRILLPLYLYLDFFLISENSKKDG